MTTGEGQHPDRLPFPLYHGTSTLWKESILQHGLGGRDIVRELRALEFYRSAAEHLRNVPEDLQPGLVDQLVISHICAQDVTSTRFNFRHGGGVYLTPSRQAAARYAADFGSELLRECDLLHSAILRAEHGSPPVWMKDYRRLISTFADPGKPLLLRIGDVHLDDLVAEDGTDARDQAERLLSAIADHKREAERRDSLRRAAQTGDIQALVELWRGSDPLTTEQVIEVLGQQVNFRAKTIFPASGIEFEQD